MTRSVAKVVLLAFLSLGIAWVGGGAASGDVLVTRDGAQVETEGPWEVRGRLVVFTRAGGMLSSIRLSEVDLEASETATAEAQRAAEEAARGEDDSEAGADPEAGEDRPTARTEATWKLTDADFTRRLRIPQDAGDSGEETAGEASAAGGERPETGPPVILSHQPENDLVDQHVIVTGSLGNLTQTTATAISLEISLYDERNELIQMRRAVLDDPALLPGESTSFRADFPEVFSFAAIRFRPVSTNLKTGSNETAPEGDSEPAASDESGAPSGSTRSP